MKMRYILGLLLLPVIAIAQTTTPLINKTTKVWVSPTAAEIATANFYGLTTNPLSQFAATTSAQLAGVLNDETGFSSGALAVFSISPTFTTSIVVPAINGGTAANDDLRVQGTTNATRTSSYVTLQENGGFVGIGAATPDIFLDVRGSAASSLVKLFNSSVTGYSAVDAYNNSGVQKAGFGYGNASVGSTALRNNGYFWTPSGTNFVINSGNLATVALTADGTTGVITAGVHLVNGVVSFSGINADPNADRITFWDDSASAVGWLTLSGLTITGTTLTVDAATESAAGKGEISTTAEAQAMTNDATFMTPLKVAAAMNYTTTVNITADNQVITVGTARTIQVTSDSATATSRSFTLDSPVTDGKELTLVWNDSGGNKGELLGSNTLMRQIPYTFNGQGDMLHFKSGAGLWVLIGVARGDDLYSTDEAVCGLWIDGSTLYRKTVDIGTLPNATTSTDAHGISGGSFSGGSFKRIYGYATNGTQTFPIPSADATTTLNNISVKADGTNITVGTGINFTAYSGHVTLEYTK